jgi:hypothetical protein
LIRGVEGLMFCANIKGRIHEELTGQRIPQNFLATFKNDNVSALKIYGSSFVSIKLGFS